MTLNKNIAFRRSAEDYCEARNQVVMHMTEGHAALKRAEELSNSFVPYGFPLEAQPRECLARTIRSLDGRWWRSLFNLTGLPKIMDAKAIDEFTRELETDKMPEFTIENIESTFLSMFQKRDEMFGRGVYEVFRRLHHWNGRYKTNEKQKFAIGSKVVMEHAFSQKWNARAIEVRYNHRNTWNDIDRCFRVLAGMDYEAGGLVTELTQHFTVNDYTVPFENELFRVRGFLNGNAHIWFLNTEALDAVNQTIGDYCDGNAIPNAA